ncbi:MAG: hypothetical protein JWQ01_2867 [Massilia sp.]|nr:hypothetical protein [Massilia sp.]
MKKLLGFLTASLLLAANAHAQSSKAPTAGQAAAPPPAWDHAGHIRLCERRGDKRCAVLTIPPGVSKGITGVVSTKVVPGVAQSFIIAGRKDVYLCASGVSGIAKLRCQRLPPTAPTLGAPPPELAAANLQNTITRLLAPRPVRAATGVRSLGSCDGGYDDETGEPQIGSCGDDDSGGGSGGGGAGDDGGGSWTDVPDPESDSTGQPTAEDIAGPWISEALAENEIAFGQSGSNFKIDPAQCNTLIARCREDCSDRTNSRQAMCGTLAGLIAIGPGLAKAAALLVGGACLYNVSERGIACKSDCTFLACIPQ